MFAIYEKIVRFQNLMAATWKIAVDFFSSKKDTLKQGRCNMILDFVVKGGGGGLQLFFVFDLF